MTEYATVLDRWKATVKRKNSVLCAGLDPAEFEMGRGDESLLPGVIKRDWAMRYLEAVAPYCAAVKPNIQYWRAGSDMETLELVGEFAREHGLFAINDCKLADIGSTNDAGIYHESRRVHAVTVAPFAGNLEEIAKQAQARKMGAICMCLMSNPDYKTQKNKLVDVEGKVELYRPQDIINVDLDGTGKLVPHVRQYMQLACDSRLFGIDGLVIGAPSTKNHIKDHELANARYYAGPEGESKLFVLLPGVGKQGGEAGLIWNHFPKDMVIVNVGRAMMFPKGASSTPADQAEAAKMYRDMLNELRTAA